jgi:hypothetical protein
LLLIFEQMRPTGRSWAYTMRGPGAAEGSWAGGLGISQLEGDDEIAHFFSEPPEIPCF